jgi:hypothetical protein
MTKVFIRTCIRDDYLSRLCYESFKLTEMKAEYYFLAEDVQQSQFGVKEYTFSSNDILPQLMRPCTNNFGGAAGVDGLVGTFRVARELKLRNDELLIVCDSDIVVFTDVLEEIKNIDFEHLGKGGPYEDEHRNKDVYCFTHVSGQFNVYTGEYVEKFLNFIERDNQANLNIRALVEEMHSQKYHVADDTFVSYVGEKYLNVKKHTINPANIWLHDKFYNYTGNEEWETIVETILDEDIKSR